MFIKDFGISLTVGLDQICSDCPDSALKFYSQGIHCCLADCRPAEKVWSVGASQCFADLIEECREHLYTIIQNPLAGNHTYCAVRMYGYLKSQEQWISFSTELIKNNYAISSTSYLVIT